MSVNGLTTFDGVEQSSQQSEAYPYRWKLCLMHLSFAFTSRMWDIGIIFLIADLTNNSLVVVALAGLMNNLALILLMSQIGNYLDNTDRLTVVRIALGVKVIILTIAYAICAFLGFYCEYPEINLLIYGLPILCALATLSFTTIAQSVEKDWIVVLSKGDSQWLSSTNAMMTQIDSGVNSFAPVITGFIFSAFSQPVSAVILLVTNVGAVCFLYAFLKNLYCSWPELGLRNPAVANADSTTIQFNAEARSVSPITSTPISPTPEQSLLAKLANFCSLHSFDDFRNCGCSGAMVAYAMLWLTVLSFGSLMTVYLRWAGVSDEWIGMGRGLAAFAGLCGAAVFPICNAYLGLYWTSALSIFQQCVLVCGAALGFFIFETHIMVTVLMLTVLLSRTGLWMFDLGVRQIAQETIPEHCRGRVNGQWRSLMAVFEMTSYILALIFNDPQHFWMLTTISAAMVFSAMVIFFIWRPSTPLGYDSLSTSTVHGSMNSSIDNSSTIPLQQGNDVLK